MARITFLILTLFTCTMSFEENMNYEGSNKLLSRRKRYLTFPEGSSFQLVFCAQNQGYLQVGDIIWFGNTAALAWELPTDPKYFHILKGHEKELIENRNGITKSIYLLDENGKVLSKLPYNKKIIVNPAFAKRSVISNNDISSKNMHEKQMNKSFLQNLDHDSIEFHRRGRKDFYSKLEGFIYALGFSGQECVLRMLCETGQGTSEQGTFFEEIMRATFTFPQRKQTEPSKHLYDEAHSTKHDCGVIYSACKLA